MLAYHGLRGEGRMSRRRFGPGPGSTFAGIARSIRKVRRWKGGFDNAVIASLGTDVRSLVSPADYEQSTTLEPSGVTFAGGPVSLCVTTDVVPMHFAYAIIVADNDEVLNTTINDSYLTDEDVLWSGCGTCSLETPFHVDFRIKTARKLHNDRIVFLLDNNTAAAGVFSLVSRLMMLGG